MERPAIVISDRAKKRLKSKHPWIFSNEITQKPADIPPGELIEIRDAQSHRIALGYYNPHTLISARILSFHHEFDLSERITKAFEYRKMHYDQDVYRLVYGESDGLPGLIVDRYSQTLVVQILTSGMERFREQIIQSLVAIVAPERILFRNDSPYRELEGLQQSTEWVYGTPADRDVIEVDGLKFEIQFTSGQKTGFFLDQQTNRRQLLNYAKGSNMLDIFSYSGAWSIYAAKAGMKDITVVDSSAEALNIAEVNAKLNNFEIKCLQEDAFQFLRKAYSSEKRYDMIVLDPPAFAKSKKHLAEAVKGYREINLRAMKLLNRDGILVTCSCSQTVTPDLFLDILRQAAADSGRNFHLRELLLHPLDHPVLLTFPESLYLKCAYLQVTG
jgi:23S rRNA (cytosine1962-C5)-methyltransferase